MRKRTTPRWKLGVGLVAAIALIAALTKASPATAIALVTAALVAAGTSAVLWGADSRDGRDWVSARESRSHAVRGTRMQAMTENGEMRRSRDDG